MNLAAFITWLTVTLAPFGVTAPTDASTRACEPTATEKSSDEERCATSNEKSGEEEEEPGKTSWNPSFFISNGF